MQNILELSERYSALREQKDEIKQQLNDIENKLKVVEAALLDAMVEAEMQNFKRADGMQFIVVNKIYPNAIPETKQELYTILREQGFDDLFTINSQTLSSTLREWEEEAKYDEDKRNLLALIAPYVHKEERLSIQMRKSKK